MNRIQQLTLLLTSLGCLLIGEAIQAATPPNVLFIAIDDLNDWVGFLDGHPQARTPNMDRLARRGVIFTNAHCTAPICGPSRAAVMTGLQPYHTGLYTNAANLSRRRTDLVTLPRFFKQHGYHVMGTGKLFHGKAPKNAFHEYGPTSDSGGASGGPFTKEELATSKQNPTHRVDRGPGKLQAVLPLNRMPCDRDYRSSNTFDWGPVDVTDEEMSDGLANQWAIKQLKRRHEKPFFLGVGYFRPHQPLFAPRKYHQMFPPDQVQLPRVLANDLADLGKVGRDYGLVAATSGLHQTVIDNQQWKPAVSSYLACVTFVDTLLGRLLDVLDQGPYAENTWIVLWSDHGWHLGEKEHWGKATGWERASHVPLVIVPPKSAAPKGFQPGTRSDRMVSLIDLFPTLVDACQLKPAPVLDGKILLPLVRQPTAPWSAATVITWARGNHAVQTDRWRYMHYYDGSQELYDHRTDPHEWHNLADQAAFQQQKQQLQKWVPGNADVEQFVRMGKWKAVFPARGSHLGNEPLLFDTEYRNGIEERTSVAEEHPEVVKKIRQRVKGAGQPEKYLTVDP
jgi:arylsulfatase A-like enzyme